MRKFLLPAFAAGIGWVLCEGLIFPKLDRVGEVKSKLDQAASAHDPAAMKSANQAGSLVRSNSFSDGTQAGLMKLPDGEKVKFWFRSHHLPPGISYTRFDFSDGSRRYIEGHFCCEVMLPEDEIRTKADLLSFLKKNHGSPP